MSAVAKIMHAWLLIHVCFEPTATKHSSHPAGSGRTDMCACMLESIFGEILLQQADIHTFFLALAKTSQIDISDWPCQVQQKSGF